MDSLTFKLNSLSVEFDRNYGISKRTGWSIAIDGRYLVELEKRLVKAIWKAIKNR